MGNPVFKHILILLALVVIVSSFETPTRKKDVKKYETPKEVLDALNQIMLNLDKVKKKLPTKGETK